jgi:hypothetical protein
MMDENKEAGRSPAASVMRKLGMEPDPWQVEVLEGNHPRLLLNCCRQAENRRSSPCSAWSRR